jgi:hypothetical protein
MLKVPRENKRSLQEQSYCFILIEDHGTIGQ